MAQERGGSAGSGVPVVAGMSVDVDVWIAHVREVLRHHGFAPNPDLERSLAERFVAQSSQFAAEQERLRRRHRNTARLQGEICAHLAAGMSRVDAAQAAGVGVETLNRWMRSDEDFRRAVRRASRSSGPTDDGRRDVRPAKMTSGVRAHLVRMLSSGMTRGEAAAAAGVSRQTFYAWLRRLPEFRDAVVAAEDAAALARLSGS